MFFKALVGLFASIFLFSNFAYAEGCTQGQPIGFATTKDKRLNNGGGGGNAAAQGGGGAAGATGTPAGQGNNLAGGGLNALGGAMNPLNNRNILDNFGRGIGGVWQPPAGLNWSIVLQESGDMWHPADVIELDYESNSFGEALGKGYIPICYLSAGSWENFRPDKGDFCEEVLGEPLPGWPDERVLKVGMMELDCDGAGPKKSILEIMVARMQECASKGGLGTELDNTDAYTYSGSVTKDEMRTYMYALIQNAHASGLAVGLKNTPELVPEFEPIVQYAVNEECWEQGGCGVYESTFLANDKPVFGIEYVDPFGSCREANIKKYSVLWKTLDLDGTELLDCHEVGTGT